MAITQVIQFNAKRTSSTTDEPHTSVDEKTQEAIKKLAGVKGPQHVAIGTQVQNNHALQIISEWDNLPDQTQDSNFSSFTNNIHDLFGKPRTTYHIPLTPSPFTPRGAATAPLSEYVQVWFPTSLITPSFQQQIENDFSRFDEIFKEESTGDLGLVSGWIVEEQDHDDLKGEKAKCFFVSRGWESMRDFERSTGTEAYKRAVPILLGWNVPFKLVSLLSERFAVVRV